MTALWSISAPASGAPARSADRALEAIVALEDARDAKALLHWAAHRDPSVRARTARALGRIQDVSCLGVLDRLSRDRDARVRVEAIFALGQLWNSTGLDGLLKAAAWSHPRAVEERVRILEGLGKCATWGDAGSRCLEAALLDGEPRIRAQAGESMGVLAFRMRRARGEWVPATAPVARLAALVEDASDDVALGASYALYRLCWSPSSSRPSPATTAAWKQTACAGLTKACGHRLAEVRSFGLQGLGFALAGEGVPPSVRRALSDPDWRARVSAVEAAARGQGEDVDALVAGLLGDRSPLVVVTALRGLGQRKASAQAGPVRSLIAASGIRSQVYGEALQALASLQGAGAAQDLAKASSSPVPSVRRAAAAAWGRLLDADDAALAGRAWDVLAGLRSDPDRSVRLAALEATAAGTRHQAQTREVLVTALADRDTVARALAADALGTRKDSDAVPALLAALKDLRPEQDLEVMTSLIDALGQIGDERATPALSPWLSASQPVLARSAAQALTSIRKREVHATPRPVRARPLSSEALLFLRHALKAERAGRPWTAVLHTDRGTLFIRLDVAQAPLTCFNFVRLARRGYFEGLSFHRVVPNFVVQGGDPRGDGWGGPGYTIRCEYNPLRFGRGAVGMALAGKDTGGSQFFLTHSLQPHLDGRFTVFARLLDGGSVLDSLTAGDRIRSVTVVGP